MRCTQTSVSHFTSSRHVKLMRVCMRLHRFGFARHLSTAIDFVRSVFVVRTLFYDLSQQSIMFHNSRSRRLLSPWNAMRSSFWSILLVFRRRLRRSGACVQASLNVGQIRDVHTQTRFRSQSTCLYVNVFGPKTWYWPHENKRSKCHFIAHFFPFQWEEKKKSFEIYWPAACGWLYWWLKTTEHKYKHTPISRLLCSTVYLYLLFTIFFSSHSGFYQKREWSSIARAHAHTLRSLNDRRKKKWGIRFSSSVQQQQYQILLLLLLYTWDKCARSRARTRKNEGIQMKSGRPWQVRSFNVI